MFVLGPELTSLSLPSRSSSLSSHSHTKKHQQRPQSHKQAVSSYGVDLEAPHNTVFLDKALSRLLSSALLRTASLARPQATRSCPEAAQHRRWKHSNHLQLPQMSLPQSPVVEVVTHRSIVEHLERWRHEFRCQACGKQSSRESCSTSESSSYASNRPRCQACVPDTAARLPPRTQST